MAHQPLCGGYQAKRVCEFCALPKQALEQYVEGLMKEVLQAENIRKATKQITAAVLKSRPQQTESRRSALKQRLTEIEREEGNLISSIGKGIDPELVKDRLNALKQERMSIEGESCQMARDRSAEKTVVDIEAEIQRIIEAAGKEYSTFSSVEKHLLFKKFVRRIEVDRKANKVVCIMRRIPVVHPIIEEIEGGGDKKTTAHEENGQLLGIGVAGTGTAHDRNLGLIPADLLCISILEELR